MARAAQQRQYQALKQAIEREISRSQDEDSDSDPPSAPKPKRGNAGSKGGE